MFTQTPSFFLLLCDYFLSTIFTIAGPTEILEINSVVSLFELLVLSFSLFFETAIRGGCAPSCYRASSENFYTLEVKFYRAISRVGGLQLSVYYEDSYDSYENLALSAAFTGSVGFEIITYFFDFVFSFFNKNDNKTTTFYPIINFLFFSILFFSITALIPLNEIFISSVFSIFFISTISLLFILFYSLINFKLNFFFFFLPSGAPKYLLKFLVVVEILSYLARAVSLPARLIANSVAGHLLVKIVLGFSCLVYSSVPGFFKFVLFLPAFACLVLLCLDVLIIVLQTFVFIFLLTFYLNQAVCTGLHFPKSASATVVR